MHNFLIISLFFVLFLHPMLSHGQLRCLFKLPGVSLIDPEAETGPLSDECHSSDNRCGRAEIQVRLGGSPIEISESILLCTTEDNCGSLCEDSLLVDEEDMEAVSITNCKFACCDTDNCNQQTVEEINRRNEEEQATTASSSATTSLPFINQPGQTSSTRQAVENSEVFTTSAILTTRQSASMTLETTEETNFEYKTIPVTLTKDETTAVSDQQSTIKYRPTATDIAKVTTDEIRLTTSEVTKANESITITTENSVSDDTANGGNANLDSNVAMKLMLAITLIHYFFSLN